MAHDSDPAHSLVDVITVGERGRIVLPARIRRSLGIEPGDHLLAEVEADSSLRLVPRHTAVRRDRGAFADLRSDTSLADELIADRRREAGQEGRRRAR